MAFDAYLAIQAFGVISFVAVAPAPQGRHADWEDVEGNRRIWIGRQTALAGTAFAFTIQQPAPVVARTLCLGGSLT